MKEVSVHELKALIDRNADIQLIDVREDFEHKVSNLGGILLPMSELESRANEFGHDRDVVVYCRSGSRSGQAIQWLEQKYGYNNLYNLSGGILAWAEHIDNTFSIDWVIDEEWLS